LAAVKKRSHYFTLDKEEEKFAVCKDCEERASRGGASVKNYNTANLRNHLRHFHHKLFNELVTKECDYAKKKEDKEEEAYGKNGENKAKHANSPSWCLSNKTRTHGILITSNTS